MKKQYHTSPRAVKLGAVVAALLLSPASFAQEKERGFYVSPEIGRATIGDYCDDLTSCSDSEIAYGIDAGYQFNKHFAVEAGFLLSSGYEYSYQETVSALQQDGSTVNVDVSGKGESDYRGFLFGVRGMMPIDNFFVEGHLGANFWKLETELNATGTANGVSASTSSPEDFDGTSFYYGIGGGYTFSDNLSARLSYTRTNLEDGDADFGDASLISASVVYRF